MRRSDSSPLSNPVLIGAVTMLVVIVAVFLSYNANAGLPFVPTYDVKVDVPNASQLVKGNEVRIGGARVGSISSISPKTLPDGTTVATLDMKLNQSIEPLPVDSTIIIRPKSLLGLKYVEITPGTSEDGYAPGDTVPVSASEPPQVEFDEFIDTFDEPTRRGIQTNTLQFGAALGGRGGDLNVAIGAFRPLLRDLLPVMRVLSDPETDLDGFIQALGQSAAEVAPVAENQANLFVGGARTFQAIADVAPALQETIAEGPRTLDTAIDSFRVQQPFLRNSANLLAELRPGITALSDAAPDLSDALRVGEPVLLRTPAFDERLEDLLVSLEDFAEDERVPRGLDDLTDTADSLRPTLRFAAPAQTQCNYLSLLFRNASDLLSVSDGGSGTSQRFIIISAPEGPNNEGQPSRRAANGPGEDNHLHVNPYPNTAAPGQPQECEAGNEPYAAGQTVIGNVAGTQQAATEAVE